ncbi:MAG: tRNA (adenosine(37)-N6)-dimethylallyltransferase MiaA [Sphingobacteriaceae bacterium]
MQTNSYNCLVVLGPTASGKTKLACQLAYELNGEIISADSRQVYKGLTIGAGKDLNEYIVNGKQIPYHLIDIWETDKQFYLSDYIRELKKAFEHISSRNKLPIICGGTGLYLEVLEKDHSFTQIPENLELRNKLNELNKEELVEMLNNLRSESDPSTSPDSNRDRVTHSVDLNSKKRIIRGIEIVVYLKQHPNLKKEELLYKPKYIGIKVDAETRNQRIDDRLKYRLEHGLIEEAEGLLKQGISHERLQFLGLEYKFLSYYLQGQINKQELYTKLSTAIHQFAKRQMTWFRRMERQGIQIEWVDLNIFDPRSFRL